MSWSLCVIFLIGLTIVTSGDVLCLGDNGHVAIETQYLACCGEAEDHCQAGIPSNQHKDHNECNNCADINLDGLFWSKISSNFVKRYTLVKLQPHELDQYVCRKFHIKNSTGFSALLHTENQDPPLFISLSTVFRC